MTARLVLSVCLLGGAAMAVTTGMTGCAAFDMFRSDEPAAATMPLELENARAALVAGRTRQAEACLDEITPGLTGQPRIVAHLLMAEVRLQQDRPAEALALAGDVLASRPNDGAANEIAGKAQLKLGNFDTAGGLFAASLDASPISEGDRIRREDLRALAHGLAAYAQASPDVARDHWSGIEHGQLRSAVEQTVARQR